MVEEEDILDAWDFSSELIAICATGMDFMDLEALDLRRLVRFLCDRTSLLAAVVVAFISSLDTLKG
jgi:hypothetical protein